MRTSAGEAAPPLLRLLAGRRLAAALERMPTVTDRAYRWVAEHRSWLGRFTASGTAGGSCTASQSSSALAFWVSS